MVRWHFFVLLFTYLNTQAQTNLIPNGDFEENTGCLAGISFNYLLNWKPCGTPDYFHTCYANGFGVPYNTLGLQNPQSGNAYVGLVNIVPNSSPNNLREYIKINLSNELRDTCMYLLRLYYSLADSTRFSSMEFGVLFDTSETTCTSQHQIISEIAQITNSNTEFIDTNYVEWYLLDIIFKPLLKYSWLTIGNFKLDSNTNFIINENGKIIYPFAYLYIDNVQLYNLCEDTTILDWKNVKPQLPAGITANADGKNDKLRLMNPTFFNSLKLNLYDRWGHLLYSTNDVNFAWDGTFKGERVPIGVYQWQAVYTTIYDNKEQYATGNVTVLY